MPQSNSSGALSLRTAVAIIGAIGSVISAIAAILAVVVVTQSPTTPLPAAQAATEVEVAAMRRKLQLHQQLNELQQQEQELKCKIQRLDNPSCPPWC